MSEPFDVAVIGSGVAGLSVATKLFFDAIDLSIRPPSVAVITKETIEASNTRWAQGGIAAAFNESEDSTDLHIADTLRAGVGLCNVEAVKVLVESGPRCVLELIRLGANFDRIDGGRYQVSLEGGHSVARIIHARGLETGLEVENSLIEAVKKTATAIFEHSLAYELIIDNNVFRAVKFLDEEGRERIIEAKYCVIATGGAGNIFSVTTNPSVATGDGIGLAARAGCLLADMEFFQFHPTALEHENTPRLLISEALRGYGATIVDCNGIRFVNELATRDEVSIAIFNRMLLTGSKNVYLDARSVKDFPVHFPSLYKSLNELGFDPQTDLLPISPAAHYMCGGVVTDLDGLTTVNGVYCVGETACTGVHGANRLASNSLLEGMVFGDRVAKAILRNKSQPDPTGVIKELLSAGGQIHNVLEAINSYIGHCFRPSDAQSDTDINLATDKIRSTMMVKAGLVRDRRSLLDALELIESISIGADQDLKESIMLENIMLTCRFLAVGALNRTESRGSHYRSDYPARDDRNFCKRIFLATKLDDQKFVKRFGG